MVCNALGVVVILSGCSGGGGPPTKLKPAPDCRNNYINAFSCALTDTSMPDHVYVGLAGTDVTIVLGDHLEGTSASLRPTSGGRSAKSISVVDRLAALTLPQVLGSEPVDFGLSMTVAASHHSPTTIPLPPSKLGWSLTDMLHRVADGPLVLPGDTRPAQHTLLWTERDQKRVWGPAKTFGEIDWIAVNKKQDEKEIGVCSYNVGPDHGGFEIKAKGRDVTVTIYERQTGKVIAKQDFKAAATCPELARSTDDVVGSVDPAPMRAWLAEQAAKT